MIEQQALQRVHRLGQTQPVQQIRYVVDGEDSVERVSADLPSSTFKSHITPLGL